MMQSSTHLLEEAVANLRGKSDETIAEDCTAVDMTFSDDVPPTDRKGKTNEVKTKR
jgi:hypothetical protein